MPATSPIIILDAGPLVALADAPDPHHEWAATFIAATARPFIVTGATVAEASHLLKNGPHALGFLQKLVANMRVEDPAPVAVLAEMCRWGQRMDYADACAVLLARATKARWCSRLTTEIFQFTACRSCRRRESFALEQSGEVSFRPSNALAVDIAAEAFYSKDVATLVSHPSSTTDAERGCLIAVFNVVATHTQCLRKLHATFAAMLSLVCVTPQAEY